VPVSLPSEGPSPRPEIRFIADEVSNAVIVTTYPRLWKEIQDTIKQLDKMPRQVLIQVLAVEITHTDDTKLGMDWVGRSSIYRPRAFAIRRRTHPLGGPTRGADSSFATDRFPAPSASSESVERLESGHLTTEQEGRHQRPDVAPIVPAAGAGVPAASPATNAQTVSTATPVDL
jgi:hypothetical protein